MSRKASEIRQIMDIKNVNKITKRFGELAGQTSLQKAEKSQEKKPAIKVSKPVRRTEIPKEVPYIEDDTVIKATIFINNDLGYNFVRETYGENFVYNGQIDEQHDEVVVECTKKKLVDTAMIYSDKIEVMTPEIRKCIAYKALQLSKKYDN